MTTFRAIETEAGSLRRTGREHTIDAAGREQAIAELLTRLGVPPAEASVAPTRTLVQIGDRRWTLVAVEAPPGTAETARQRRAGPKHRTVR